jgi:hypothetical protein
MKLSGPPATVTLPDDERFSSVSRSGAVAACKSRIIELDGEILSEIATGEDDTANVAGSPAPTRK